MNTITHIRINHSILDLGDRVYVLLMIHLFPRGTVSVPLRLPALHHADSQSVSDTESLADSMRLKGFREKNYIL
jgi:hypothetical protein